MRDLTEEELKLAPDWATHYCVTKFKGQHCITFHNSYWDQWVYPVSGAWSPKMTSQRIPALAKPISTKPFDINKHEFSDDEIRFVKVFHAEEYITILLNREALNTVRHDKADIIAMAKALGVTGEDLK